MARLLIKDITKEYKNKLVLKGITLEIGPRGVYLVAGPNRAGKTTLFRILCGLAQPNSGRVMLDKRDILKNRKYLRKKIGAQVQGAEPRSGMNSRRLLRFFYVLRTLDYAHAEKKVDDAIEECQIKEPDQRISRLSNGERKKVQIALARIHSPEMIILDEPLSGLDPRAKEEIKTLIRRLGKKGLVIFSSHLLEEAEACADNIILLDRGKVPVFGPIDKILNKESLIRIRLEHIDKKTTDALKKIKQVKKIVLANDWLSVYLSGRIDPEKIMETISGAGGSIREISQGLSLKQAFIENVR